MFLSVPSGGEKVGLKNNLSEEINPSTHVFTCYTCVFTLDQMKTHVINPFSLFVLV